MTGYTGLFAMRCRAVWYVSGQLQPCGVERHSPVVPISASAFASACASHAPLPCVAAHDKNSLIRETANQTACKLCI